MAIFDSELKKEYVVKHISESIKAGSLVYLILPVFIIVRGDLNWQIWSLSVFLTLLSIVRFLWPIIFKKSEKSYVLPILYILSAIHALVASVLAGWSQMEFKQQDLVLFTTIYIATMTSGVMSAFSSAPRIAVLMGALILFPFSGFLALGTGELDYWILLGSVLFLIWNMIVVFRSFRNFVELQKYDERNEFQENRLKDFINTIPGSVSWFDNELNYLDANNTLLVTTGLEKKDIIGKNLGFANPDDAIVTKIRQFKNSNDMSEIGEISVKKGDKEFHYLMNLLRYRLGQNDEQISVLTLDISELKVKEQELERRRLQLMNQEKFTALGEMAGGIAHEINNPLAIICGKAEVLLMQIKNKKINPESLEKHVEGISTTAHRIIKIVKSLKTLVRDGRIDNIEETSVGGAIDPLMDILYSRLENFGVELRVDKSGFDLPIRCGVVELGQVLMNLIVNAAQAIENQNERWVKVEARSDMAKVFIVVTDSGKGISPEVQKKLFQPFFTTKAPGVGTGIGLSLSRELMQKQWGDLYYQSGLSHTTFILELPRGNPESAKKAS